MPYYAATKCTVKTHLHNILLNARIRPQLAVVIENAAITALFRDLAE
jgi:hypothetical protein